MDDASPATDTEQPPPEQPPPCPPSPGPPSSGPRVGRDEMADLGRLRRSVTDRHVAGVAGGIARHLDIDPIIVRVALVVGVFFGGAGLLLYVGGWILVPEEGTDDEPLGLDRRSRTIALGGVGVLALVAALGDWAGAFWFPWPLAILAALVVWFLRRHGGPSQTAPDTAPQAYGQPYGPPAEPDGWSGYARAPRPRNPRKRGPVLFFFTLALIALAEGVLGVVDVAGADVTDSAYPALALGITALMLVVGSVWGRAGGLIALGVVTALVMAGTAASSRVDEEDRYVGPATAGEVRDTYEFGGGDFTLDLSDVSDVESLDGREISVDGVGGQVEVIVPDGMDVSVRAQVVGGEVRVFDRRADGFDVTLEHDRDGGEDVPDLTISIDLFAGEVIVREAA
jgi:phage shock protein PspC (stress-responsive transcriptional regulator)